MTQFDLDAGVRDFIKRTDSFSKGLGIDATTAEVREAYMRMCAAFALPHPKGLRARDGILHAEGPTRELRVRSFATPDAIPGRAVLFLHGGGFVVGGLDSHDSICADLAAGAEVAVIALDYRLSPEHAYPAALDDAEAAYDDLLDSHQHVILVGDSAGATLAAALSLRLRRKGKPMPWAQVLIYPMLHPDFRRAIGGPKEQAPLLPAASLSLYVGAYLGGKPTVTTDPEVAPLAAQDFAGMPPTAIFAADIDPLAEDAHDYCAALRDCGVPVTLHPGHGLVHGYLRGRAMSETVAEAFSVIVSRLRDFAHGGQP
ncbi:alpha/beta hydrolase [Acidisoma silvae]|uniref:Alpha/beta hydrolase n=1 Tax=Acidisoma silvae TaxID=2802396 RepID=A0A963YQS0_9PROT|nr:alpha/beta hydrolase [Acidisoma silvae]MCB8875239.1 alpha/beta hydrolase [Acidisoma silvae]